MTKEEIVILQWRTLADTTSKWSRLTCLVVKTYQHHIPCYDALERTQHDICGILARDAKLNHEETLDRKDWEKFYEIIDEHW